MTGPAIEPPYPADLEAKGWNLDLDYERIEQSDTWAIASPEQRPWLLMLWMIAWRQSPVATLPDNDRLIAARIGLPIEKFVEWREVLLSGWELATDGRLYHRTLTQHALRMAEKRSKDRARVAAFRAKSSVVEASNDDVTRYQRVSSAPTPTPTPTEEQKPAYAGLSAEPTADLLGEAGNAPGERIKPAAPPCPHQQIIDMFHEVLPELPAVRVWNEKRRKHLQARWKEDPERQTLEWWRGFFEYIRTCPWLMGQIPGKEGRPFSCSLPWIVSPEPFAKILEGNYEARAA
jgi:hypothetical protein